MRFLKWFRGQTKQNVGAELIELRNEIRKLRENREQDAATVREAERRTQEAAREMLAARELRNQVAIDARKAATVVLLDGLRAYLMGDTNKVESHARQYSDLMTLQQRASQIQYGGSGYPASAVLGALGGALGRFHS